MVPIRFLLYFVGVALLTWALTHIEIASPGSLELQRYTHADDLLGTSEYSPVELLQVGILVVCGLLFAWVVQRSVQQRPIAITFGTFAAIFAIRELDFFLDRLVADNAWQAPVVILIAMLIVYSWRNQRRLRLAWSRLWPSPGLTLLFAGAVLHFGFIPFVGHEPLWEAVLGDSYQRVIKLAVEEFMELGAYYLWLTGSIEYWFQARALAAREPQGPERRLRNRRRRRSAKY